MLTTPIRQLPIVSRTHSQTVSQDYLNVCLCLLKWFDGGLEGGFFFLLNLGGLFWRVAV